MNWDEQLIEDCREEDGTLHPATDHVLSGVHWMLRQLRTDEAVERVAEQMFTATQADYEYWDRTDWNELHKSNQDVYRSDARAAITALLGEES